MSDATTTLNGGALEAGAEAWKTDDGDAPRLLSIQSHVVHGHVGNRAAVFPLQLLGFDVDVVNSVHFSNHPRHAHGFAGQRLSADGLREVYAGLASNALNREYAWILSGYCADAAFLRAIAEIVRDLKQQRKQAANAAGHPLPLRFACDPVLGDNGAFYVPAELAAIYRDELLPLADIVTPNAFELECVRILSQNFLSGVPVLDETSCLAAMEVLHRAGPRLVVVTSGVPPPPSSAASTPVVRCYTSEAVASGDFRQFRFEVPLLAGQFFGTGDLFAALLLAWLSTTADDVRASVRKVLATLQAVLRRTAASSSTGEGAMELRLIESRRAILSPPNEAGVGCAKIR